MPKRKSERDPNAVFKMETAGESSDGCGFYAKSLPIGWFSEDIPWGYQIADSENPDHGENCYTALGSYGQHGRWEGIVIYTGVDAGFKILNKGSVKADEVADWVEHAIREHGLIK